MNVLNVKNFDFYSETQNDNLDPKNLYQSISNYVSYEEIHNILKHFLLKCKIACMQLNQIHNP